MTITAEEKELRFLAMDIKLFLRLASTHFTAQKDLQVITRLNELADMYGAGQDVWQKEEKTNE